MRVSAGIDVSVMVDSFFTVATIFLSYTVIVLFRQDHPGADSSPCFLPRRCGSNPTFKNCWPDSGSRWDGCFQWDGQTSRAVHQCETAVQNPRPSTPCATAR